jgi:hypothetical protein
MTDPGITRPDTRRGTDTSEDSENTEHRKFYVLTLV